MTIEETIHKSIEGGLKKHYYMPTHPDIFEKDMLNYKEHFFLNPEFWKCLGKALDRDVEVCDWCGEKQCWAGELYCSRYKAAGVTKWWLYHWHSFIDHLAEGKDAHSFFAHL